ncbi:glycoside hydrolase family 10 protein [Aridibaculum aurantiacum]|uniref:glycoside hydrolase family 10 protein n=1 Tax=Aridibaculum aurantiacum TaxID=2810307 RepID=UPI001A971DFC|nr:family 10 glycosylhydrolase [Aridibaculum aurantiacum]
MRKIIIAFLLAFGSLAQAQSPHHEFRGAWIATVENIDWPSKRGLPTETQKAEFIRMLDMHHRNGLNAVVVQVRPVTDAFYPSPHEPWSEYLTGKQGQAPSPYYDPLQFMIEECHKRGMEFHAWFNPYRAVFNVNRSSVAANHVTRQHPSWFVTYGNTKYFDPGVPQAREHVNKIIRDVVDRYDVDAIHFDDYFYPYKIPGKEFPDEASFARYGNGMNRDEWRRSNVDTIIKQLGRTIKSINPRVKFGISPFGVWRNSNKDARGSASRAGVTNYDDLHADILLWLQRGWIDYVAPQLYWEIGHKLVDYKMLLDWWAANNFNRHLYIGHGLYRATEAKSGPWKDRNELPNQIKYLRNNQNVHGSIFYSSKIFNSNPNGWNDSLRNNYYRYPALQPVMKWIDSVPPLKPLVNNISKSEVRLLYRGAEPIKSFAVFAVPRGRNIRMENATLIQLIIADRTTDIDLNMMPAQNTDRLFVAAVDRNNNISEWVQVR